MDFLKCIRLIFVSSELIMVTQPQQQKGEKRKITMYGNSLMHTNFTADPYLIRKAADIKTIQQSKDSTVWEIAPVNLLVAILKF